MTHSRDDRDPARTSGDPHAVWRLVVSDTTTLLIDLATGEAVLRQEDLLPPRVGAPRPLRREYRARRTAQDSGLGPGWSLTSELPLVEDSATARPDGYDGGHGDGRGDGRDPARSVRLHRDTAGRVVRLDGPGGSTLAALRYDPAGRPVRHTDAEGAVTVLDWDAEHRLTGISDVTGTLLGLSYTASGAVGQVVLGGAEGTSHLDITYPHPAHTVLTDALGRTTAFTFDGRGRLLTVTDPLGGVRSQERDGEGRPVAVVDETGGRTVLEHDTAGRPVARVAPTSARSSVHYGDPDHPRLVTALRDPAGNEVTLAHDAAGRVVRVGAPGRSEPLDRREYGAGHGRLTALVDGEGQVTSYEYDAAGDLVAVIPPAPRGRISYEYDELGRIVAVTGGNGVRTQYRRDGVGRLVEVTGPDGVLLTLEHDALGRVVRRAGTGWHHDYSWVSTTGGSRLTTVVRTDSTGQETIEASYDPDGALRSLATAGGTTSYDYDGAGRLARVRTPTGHTAHFTRDAAGRVLRTDLGGAVQEISYDEAGRRASLTLLGPAGETLLHAGYDYRGPDGADGDRLRRLVLDGEATEFDYDPLGRLVRAGGTTYAYDAAHNLVRLGETAFTIGAAGEVTRFGATEFDYDGAGNFVEEVNPTGSFRYSATNQTVLGIFGGAVVADIAHDGLGQQTPRRVAETTPDGRSVTHVLSHGPLGIARVTDDGVPLDVVRAPDGTVLAVITAERRLLWTVTDHQGSVLALVDETGRLAAGYRYTPHGAVSPRGTDAAVNPFRYRGAYQLLRSAHFLDNRLYNGFWGRFTQPDPTGRQYGPYTFADNDPLGAGIPGRHDFWAALAGPPHLAAALFFPPTALSPLAGHPLPGLAADPAGLADPADPAGSADGPAARAALLALIGPGVTPDRTPHITDSVPPSAATGARRAPHPEGTSRHG